LKMLILFGYKYVFSVGYQHFMFSVKSLIKLFNHKGSLPENLNGWFLLPKFGIIIFNHKPYQLPTLVA